MQQYSTAVARERPDERWAWENPSPLGDAWIRGGWMFSARDVWVVGEHGTILRWKGKDWSRLPLASGAGLRGMWASSPDDAWIVGDDCTLLHWNGRRLSPESLDGCRGRDLLAVSGSGPRDVWVVGAAGFTARWNGKSWSLAKGATRDLRSVLAHAPDDAWAAGSEMLHWDGASWSPSRLPGATPGAMSLGGLWGSSPSDVWVAGHPASFHWDGAAWTRAAMPKTGIYYSFWGSGPRDVWASGHRAVAHFDGSEWTATPRPETNLGTILGKGPDEIVAFGGRDVIRWNGSSWRPLSSAISPYNFLQSVGGTSRSDLWAVGDRGILHRDGRGWSASPCEDSLPDGECGGSAVWASGPRDAWSVGPGGRALRWDGKLWRAVSTGTALGLRGVWGSGPRDVWAVGDDGVVLRWNGSAWSRASAPATSYLTSVWGTGPRDVWAAGSAVLHWDGSAWRSVDTGSRPAGGRGIFGFGEDDVWLGGLEKVGGAGLTSVRRFDGSGWSAVGEPFSTHALWGPKTDDLWVVGGASGLGGVGIVRHYQRGRWTEIDGLTSHRLRGIWGDGASMWIVGENASILRRDLRP